MTAPVQRTILSTQFQKLSVKDTYKKIGPEVLNMSSSQLYKTHPKNEQEARERYIQKIKHWGVRQALTSPTGRPLKGTYGELYWTKRDNVVVKISSTKNMKIYVQAARAEIAVLKLLTEQRAPHSVRQLDSASYLDRQYASFQEYLGLNLADQFLNQSSEILNINKIEAIAKQWLEYLSFLAKLKKLHGDIKPSNAASDKYGNLGVFDLGFSKSIPDSSKEILYSSWYRPIEVILEREINVSADTWALGCVLYELTTKSALIPIRDKEDSGNLEELHELLQKLGIIDKNIKLSEDQIKVLTERYCISKKGQDTYYFLILTDLKMIHRQFQRLGIKNEKLETVLSKDLVKGLISRNLLRKKDGHYSLVPLNFDSHWRPFPASIRERFKADTTSKQKLELFIDLLSQMLTINPSKRSTAYNLLKHRFFYTERSDVSFSLKVTGCTKNFWMKVVDCFEKTRQHFPLYNIKPCYHIPISNKPHSFQIYRKGDPREIRENSHLVRNHSSITINLDELEFRKLPLITKQAQKTQPKAKPKPPPIPQIRDTSLPQRYPLKFDPIERKSDTKTGKYPLRLPVGDVKSKNIGQYLYRK